MIDASIPLRAQGFRVESPTNQLAKALQLQGAVNQNQAQQFAMQQQQASLERQNKLREILASGGDENALMQGGYLTEARSLVESKAKTAKDQREAEKSALENMSKRIGLVGQISGAAKDQNSWNFARQALQKSGLDVSGLPEQFDPNTIGQLQAQALEASQQLDQVWKQKGYDREVAANKETARHNLATESATLRGQNMVDAREREMPRGVPVETDKGPVLVNPRTGVATPVTVNGAPAGAKQPEFAKKESASIQAQLNIIDAAMDAVSKTPTAFGAVRGAASKTGVTEAAAQRLATDDEQQARAFVFNVVSKVINERAGTAQSKQELARLNGFLPGDLDDARTVRNKLQGFKEYLAEQGKAYGPKQTRISSDDEYNALPSGAVFIDPNGQQRRKP